MTKKRTQQKLVKEILNRQARFNYELLENFTAGVVLSGGEVKALRAGKAHLNSAYVTLTPTGALLKNAYIGPYQEANTPKDYEPNHDRALLLGKKELATLRRELNTAGLTIVPLKWYNGRRVKLEIALARGKKKADKRQSLKTRDTKRDIERTLKAS